MTKALPKTEADYVILSITQNYTEEKRITEYLHVGVAWFNLEILYATNTINAMAYYRGDREGGRD